MTRLASGRAGAAGARTGTGTCRCRPPARGPAQTATSRAAVAARNSSSPAAAGATDVRQRRPVAAPRAGQPCARGALGRPSRGQRSRTARSAGGDSAFQAHRLRFTSADMCCFLSQRLFSLPACEQARLTESCPRKALAARHRPPAQEAPAAAASRPASRGAGCSAGRSPGRRSSHGCPVLRMRTGRRTAGAPPRPHTLCRRDNEQGFVLGPEQPHDTSCPKRPNFSARREHITARGCVARRAALVGCGNGKLGRNPICAYLQRGCRGCGLQCSEQPGGGHVHAAGWRGSACRAKSGLLTTSRPGCTPWRAPAQARSERRAQAASRSKEVFLVHDAVLTVDARLSNHGVCVPQARTALQPLLHNLEDSDCPLGKMKVTSCGFLGPDAACAGSVGGAKDDRRAAPAAAAWPPQTAGRAASRRFRCWGSGMPGRRPTQALPRAAARARSRPRRTPPPHLGAPRRA
jgi:hypothetical protein